MVHAVRTDGRTDGQTDGRTDGQMDRRTVGQTDDGRKVIVIAHRFAKKWVYTLFDGNTC